MAISKVTVNDLVEYQAEVISQRAKVPLPFYEKKRKTEAGGAFPWLVTFTDIIKGMQEKEPSNASFGELSTLVPGITQTNINDNFKKVQQFDSEGVQKRIALRLTQNKIKIKFRGFYAISWFLTFVGDVLEVYNFSLFLNDVEVPKTRVTMVEKGDVSRDCIIKLLVDDEVDIRVKTTSPGNSNLTINSGNFIVRKNI